MELILELGPVAAGCDRCVQDNVAPGHCASGEKSKREEGRVIRRGQSSV